MHKLSHPEQQQYLAVARLQHLNTLGVTRVDDYGRVFGRSLRFLLSVASPAGVAMRCNVFGRVIVVGFSLLGFTATVEAQAPPGLNEAMKAQARAAVLICDYDLWSTLLNQYRAINGIGEQFSVPQGFPT
jgi:hypothetical protein